MKNKNKLIFVGLSIILMVIITSFGTIIVLEAQSTTKNGNSEDDEIINVVKTYWKYVEDGNFKSAEALTTKELNGLAVEIDNQIPAERWLNSYKIEYIEATIQDYEIAYSLQSEMISSSISELNPMCKDLYDTITLSVAKIAKVEAKDCQAIDFTRKEVRNWSMKPDFVIKKIMRELESLEYLTKRISGLGGRYVYRLTILDLKTQHPNTLLHPKELLELI